MENKEIIKKLKDFVEELENEEKLKIPSFADATKEELNEVLRKYRSGELDLKDYWKPGDKKVTEDGCEYVILDIGYDLAVINNTYDSRVGGIKCIEVGYRTVTVMRTDLVDLEVSLRSIHKNYDELDFKKTKLFREFEKNPTYFVGDFFSEFCNTVHKEDICSIGTPCSGYKVFIPSKEEIFDEEKAYEYFKNPENRKLGNSWWSRSGFLDSDSYASFVNCRSAGSQYTSSPTTSHGLAPCFAL